MKKAFLIALSITVFGVVWWLILLISIGVNFAMLGRPTGAITGLGPIVGLWISYKVARGFWKKYSVKLGD
jgi:hypothetical protein